MCIVSVDQAASFNAAPRFAASSLRSKRTVRARNQPPSLYVAGVEHDSERGAEALGGEVAAEASLDLASVACESALALSKLLLT